MKVRIALPCLAFAFVSTHLAVVVKGLPYASGWDLPDPASKARHGLPVSSGSHTNEWQLTCVGGMFLIPSFIYTAQAEIIGFASAARCSALFGTACRADGSVSHPASINDVTNHGLKIGDCQGFTKRPAGFCRCDKKAFSLPQDLDGR